MALPSDFVQTAVLGITDIQPDYSTLTPILAHCQNDVERLLIAINVAQTQTQPLYLIHDINNCNLSERRRSLVGARAFQFLHVMFKGYQSETLPEWFSSVQQQRKQISPEYVPILLEYGATYPTYQPLILLVLGKRGLWLAAQNPMWAWVNHTHIKKPRFQREDTIIDLLRKRRKGIHDDHPALPMLIELQQIYSEALGNALIKSLRAHLHSRTRRPDWKLRWSVKKFATFLPISLRTSLVNVLNGRLNNRNYWRNAVYEAQVILNFRRAMIEAISR